MTTLVSSATSQSLCPADRRDHFMKKVFVFALLVILSPVAETRAYGPDGHKIIGAIADQRLAKTPTGARVSELLDGYTLQEASIMADTIKQWDKPGIEDPKVQKYFSSHPKIAEQLRAFWKANMPPTDDEISHPFASLVSLHRRAAGGRRKVRRRQSGAQRMGHCPHDGLLHRGSAWRKAGG